MSPQTKSLITIGKKIKQKDRLYFSQHLSTMLSAGIPLLTALNLLLEEQGNPNMQRTLQSLIHSVSQGNSFASSLKCHKDIFSVLFRQLIHAGEESGTLEKMLQYAAEYDERALSINTKIKKALMYPTIVLISTGMIAALLMLYIVPEFEKLFDSLGATLPVATKFTLKISASFQRNRWHFLLTITIIILAFKICKEYSPQFVKGVDHALLKFTVIGPLIEKTMIARFSRTLATLLKAGTPLVDALTLTSEVIQNSLFKNALVECGEAITQGNSLSKALIDTKIFPGRVIQMIFIGEQSSSLEEMLDKIATLHEKEITSIINHLSSLMEPLIMLIIGTIIGAFVLTMYLPVFQLGSVF